MTKFKTQKSRILATKEKVNSFPNISNTYNDYGKLPNPKWLILFTRGVTNFVHTTIPGSFKLDKCVKLD